MRRHGKVLVFGDDTRSFLAIVRSLGRGGIEVHAVPADLTSPSLRSRFISAVHRIPPYVGDGREWCAAVEALLRDGAFDLAIPCDERALLPLDRHRNVFAPFCRLAIPDHDAIETLFDKRKTRELAAALGVPIAPGRSIGPGDDAATLAATFGLPLVVKPASSYTLETIFTRGRVGVFHHEAELARAFATFGNESYIVEGYRPGRGTGLSILAHAGRVLQAFQHTRARERGGASFYRVSAAISEDLASAVEKIVAATGLTGVAMFEFKVDEGSEQRPRTWVLLEVNARPWGSMPLPLALGIDFPLRWYRLLVEGEETAPLPYRAGIYQRNLVPDVRQILTSAQGRRGALAKTLYFLRAASEARRLVTGREHLDVLVADDPAPGLSEISETLGASGRRFLGRLPMGERFGRRRDRGIVRRAIQEASGKPVILLVLCSGNICRSPFAAELLRRSLFDHAANIEIVGAGLLPRNGATSPEAAIIAARAHGVDLGSHHATYVREEDVRRATLIVLFDRHNQHRLRARDPGLLRRAIMLGSFLETTRAAREIADPDGGDLATFDATYKEISIAVAGLAAAIEEERMA